MKIRSLGVAALALVVLVASSSISAQTTVFSYQGRLIQGGNPANGPFEMQFKLFDAPSGGSQIGTTVTINPVTVTNGDFSVRLDFGASAYPGADRYLDITVAGTPLAPRSQILSTPYAIRALTVSGPVTGSNPTASLTVTNAQPGIPNPEPGNLPPAALRGEATSTVDSNVGLLGIGNGGAGLGVVGITNGNGTTSGQGDAIGVLGLSFSPTGETIGVKGEVSSPNGTAVEAAVGTSGFLFRGSSDEPSTGNPKFVVTAAGQVRANAGVFAKNFQLNSGLFSVLETGNLTANNINASRVDTTGNVVVGGTLQAQNVSIGSGNLNLNNITTTGNVTVGGALNVSTINPAQTLVVNGAINAGAGNFTGLLGAPTISGNTVNAGILQTGSITTPSGILNLGSSNVQTSGEGLFGFLRTGFPLSGGDVHLCVLSNAPNYIRMCSSSLRYKDHVRPFDGGLEILKRLKPISFVWKESGTKSIGFGAEDVEHVDSRLAYRNEAGQVEGVRYDQMTALLVNAIKLQQEQIDRLQSKVDALTKAVRRNRPRANSRKVR